MKILRCIFMLQPKGPVKGRLMNATTMIHQTTLPARFQFMKYSTKHKPRRQPWVYVVSAIGSPHCVSYTHGQIVPVAVVKNHGIHLDEIPGAPCTTP